MPTGLTRDAGWQIGVSRTIRATPKDVWEALLSDDGLAAWLAPGATIDLTPGSAWSAPDGSRGEVRSHQPVELVRVTSRPAGWDHDTTVQVRVVPASDGRTSLHFHQEHLADADERARQRDHWHAVIDHLEDALAAADEPA